MAKSRLILNPCVDRLRKAQYLHLLQLIVALNCHLTFIADYLSMRNLFKLIDCWLGYFVNLYNPTLTRLMP